MSSLCTDDLSPVSFDSLNGSNFILTPNLLLHADDSVKSDDLDLSLLAWSSSKDDSDSEVSPPHILSSTDWNGGVKEGLCTADEDTNIPGVAECLGNVQLKPQCKSTSNGKEKSVVRSTELDYEPKVLECDVECRKIAHFVTLPNSPLHEVVDFLAESGQVAQYITVGNSPLHEVLRSLESEQVTYSATLKNSSLHELEHHAESIHVTHVAHCDTDRQKHSPRHDKLESCIENEAAAQYVMHKTSPLFKDCRKCKGRAETLPHEKGIQFNCQRGPTISSLCTDSDKAFSQEKSGPSIPLGSDTEANSSCRSKHRGFSQTHYHTDLVKPQSQTHLAQKHKYLRKNKKPSRVKSFTTESDSDTSVEFRITPNKYKTGFDSNDADGIHIKPSCSLRRSRRIPKRRFKLDIVDLDSDSDSTGPVRKSQRRRRRQLSSSCSDSEHLVPLRRSERIPKKKAYSGSAVFGHKYKDDIREAESGTDQQFTRKQDFSYLDTEGKRIGQTNPLKRQGRADYQPSSPEFIPVAEVIYQYHHQSHSRKTPDSPTGLENNTHIPVEFTCDEKKNSDTTEEPPVPNQVEQNILPGSGELETRADLSRQEKTSFQYKDTDLNKLLTQNSPDSVETSKQKQTVFETSESQVNNSPGKTHSVESSETQSDEREKENASLIPTEVQVKSKVCQRQVLSENIDRQASSGFGTITFHSTPKGKDEQATHKGETTPPKCAAADPSLRRKVSKSKSAQSNHKGKSLFKLKPAKVQSKLKQVKAQFVFRVQLKEPLGPFSTTKLRKTRSLHLTDKANQNMPVFESVMGKTANKDKKNSVSVPKRTESNFKGGDLSVDKTCTDAAISTRRQKGVVLKDRDEHLQQRTSFRTDTSSQTQKSEKVGCIDPSNKQSHVHSRKRKRTSSNFKAVECTTGKSDMPQTLKTDIDSTGGGNSPFKSSPADSDHMHCRQALSNLNTPETCGKESDLIEVKGKEKYFNRKKGVKSKGTHNRHRGGGEKEFNFISLTKAVGSESDAIEFCQQHNLLPKTSQCPKCGAFLTKLYKIVRTVKTTSVEFRFQCNRKVCKSRGQIPVRNLHWFSKSANILCCQHLLIFYLFSNQFTAEQAIEESVVTCENIHLGTTFSKKQVKTVCSETVQELYNFCREVCVLSLPDPQPIGGCNSTVVILEAKFGKTKHCTRVFPEGQLVLGAFCRQTDVVFFVPVPALESEHVIPVIQRYVKKGTEVQTDNSNIYRKLGKLGYKHIALNHSQHDIDSETGRCLKHNKDSIWWMKKKKAPSTSTSMSMSSCTADFSSSVSRSVKESLTENSKSPEIQAFTPCDRPVKMKLKFSTPVSDSTDSMRIHSLSRSLSVSSIWDSSGEAYIPNPSVSNPSVSSGLRSRSSSSSGIFSTCSSHSMSENIAITSPSATASFIGSPGTLVTESSKSTGADNWIFALHMAEFLWRRIHRNDKDTFLSFLQAIVQVLPFDQH